MDDDYVITPDFSRRATVRSIAPPPPRPPPPPAPAATRRQAPSLTPSTPRYEPPPVFNGPRVEYISPTARSQEPTLMTLPALGDPTISSTINYSPNVETNYSQNQSYYLKQGQGGGNVEDWYQYPTQTGEILFDVAGEGQQTLQALTPIGPPFITDLLFNGTSVLPYTWYDYPTLTGEVEFIDASGSHLLKSISGNLYYDGQLLVKAGDLENISDWSLYPMINPIVGNGFSIGGVLDVSASGVVQGGSLVAIGDISGATLHTGVAAVGSLEATGDISGASLHISGVAAVGSLEATGDISGSTLHVSGTATLHDIDLSGCALTTNGAGSALFVNGVEVQTGTPSDASQWSIYPALQAVDVSGYAINKATIINTSGLTIAGNTLIQGTLNTTGLITQDTVIGSPTENFLGNPLTIGTSVGIPPVDVTNGGLTVHGPTVLDGGTVHGCTIGSLPVLGINTVRVDVLPVGVDIVSPTFVTANAGGAVNLSAGLAAQLSAGTYVSLQASTGTGTFNGVVVEAPFSSSCNLWFPYGGNIYGATDISSGTMHTGTLTASVDVSGASGHFGPLYTSDTKIHLGSDAGLTSQGAGAVAIGTEAGSSAQGANAIAIGFTAGSLSQEFGGVAVGNEAAFAGQRSNAVAIGTYAGRVTQGSASVAIGLEAGYNTQGANSVAVGWEAGQETQGANSVAVGWDAGFDTQGTGSVAVGNAAGSTNQGNGSVCVGQNAGYSSLGSNSVAVGAGAAGATSGTYVTAIGYGAGQAGLGSNSVAIGAFSATNGGAFANTIVINATGAILDPSGANSFYVNPIADLSGGIGFNMLGHQSATGEIRRGTATLTQAQNTISNTQQISYDTGLLTTTIAGITQLQTVKADGPATIGTPGTPSSLTVEGTIKVGDLSYVDTGAVVAADTKAGFLQTFLGQNKSADPNASANVVVVNDSAGTDYAALGINSSTFGNINNTLFEIPNASYASSTADMVIGAQSDHSSTASLYMTYNSGASAYCIDSSGALSLNASRPGGVLNKGNFGTSGQVLASAGPAAPPTWVSAASAAGLIGAANTFWVAENGVDVSGGGQVYAPFRTIQFAIDKCSAGAQDNGQTIFIYPGLYVENLTIADKNINFRGSSDTQHTYNTTIRGNMTITSSNTNRSYRTVSFQFLQIQNYTATTGTAITLSTSGTGKGRLVLTGCYVIGASTGVRLLDATAANCDWIIICDTTRFYTAFAYSQPLLDLSGNSGTAPSLTLNQSLVEYESPAGSTNSLVKVGGYSALTTQYSTITQPLNATLNNSALTNGLVWVANLPNSGVVATSTNGANIGTTLMFSGTQATLGVAGTTAMFIERNCPSVYLIGGTLSVRSNSTPATHAVVGSGTGVTKTIIYFNTSNMMTTRGSANKVDATNLTTTPLIALT